VGKVGVRKGKDKWTVEDEATLLDTLAKRLTADQYAEVVKTKPSIVKAVLDTILSNWETTNEIPTSVAKVVAADSVSVTIDKTIDSTVIDAQKVDVITTAVDSANSEPGDALSQCDALTTF
jgi:hypothetical protein